MFCACLHAATHCNSCAFTADKLFFFEVCVVLISLIAVFHASKIRLLALEAHIIGKLAQSVLLELTIKSVFLDLAYSVVFVQFFKFGSFKSLFNDNLLKLFSLFDFFVKNWAMRSTDSLLTVRAIKVVEHNSGTIVALLDLTEDTVNMVYMAACELNTRHLTHASNVAD